MKIASWNVNSIKARKDHVIKYLQNTDLDVLMVQELKGLEFPAEDFKAIGYETAAVTQKASPKTAPPTKNSPTNSHG